MTRISATKPLQTSLQRAVECLASDAPSVVGDELGVNLQRGPVIRQQVAVELGAAEIAGDTARWALSWEPIGHPVTLPAFSGTLTVCERDDGTTTLQVAGTYRPPLGLVGVIVDRAIGHRVAEVSIEHFATGVARRLDETALLYGSWRPGPEPAPDPRPV